MPVPTAKKARTEPDSDVSVARLLEREDVNSSLRTLDGAFSSASAMLCHLLVTVPRLQQQQQQQQPHHQGEMESGMKGGLWRLIVAPNEPATTTTSQPRPLVVGIINKLLV